MKQNLLRLLAGLTLTTGYAFAATLETDLQKTSYALGTDLGRNLLTTGQSIDIEAFSAGMADALAEKDSALTDEQMRQFLQAFQMKARETHMEKMRLAGAENVKKSEVFLSENSKKDGVKQLPSGLQYRVLEEGTGAKPLATDRVRVHYTGRLIDGTVFDSSVQRGTPAEFGLNQVIPGWTEGVQLMKEGAKYEFVIPHTLAYGENGSPPRIPPSSTLVFEVELLKILE